ncbi:isochorismatase family cysteine hydrolase [Sinorhizobium sp. RAC02]|uniref:cysteine hydrolase family protein n=1 Tax=Sinorhizobium sp. RAC02 TaxID=1842534 RepID=UPI00083D93E1|nr:isochorismatase family cysteine hydrolase [Sinorhizobium sp. RAC02]AOF93025.1 isochorismatase family protein [Sinorhizobium sp. RAC02]
MLGNWRHICVDMQRMFAEDTPWRVSWMEAVSPQVVEVAERYSARTTFTRFCPPVRPSDAHGMWRTYYEKWWMMTGEHLSPDLLALVPELARYCPPATIFNKTVYSPWIDGRLHSWLARKAVDTLVITGGETDVCVLATALGGIDLGYRVIVLKDAVCSGADKTHDASLTLLGNRFSAQVELLLTEEFLSSDPGRNI